MYTNSNTVTLTATTTTKINLKNADFKLFLHYVHIIIYMQLQVLFITEVQTDSWNINQHIQIRINK